MTSKKLILVFVFFTFLIFPFFSFAQGVDSSTSSGQTTLIQQLQKQIEALTKQIQTLQQQLQETRSELGVTAPAPTTSVSSESLVTEETSTESPPEFTRTLSRGISGDDVRKLQEFLKKDKEIYPDGLITGYFGPKTEQALKKWQEKHNIEAVGILGPQTRARFQELGKGVIQGLLQQGTPSEIIPPGLLTAPGIQKKIEVSTSTSSGQATTTRSQEDLCSKDPTKCYTEKTCKAQNFYWYTVSCHKELPRYGTCAESNIYCINSDECSKGGFYWCRNSCYATSTACLGQTFVPPVQPVIPATPATPAQPTSQTSTATVPATSATPAVPAIVATTTTTKGDITPPSTPTGLTATSYSPYGITLSWNKSTDNIGVVGYKVYRNGTQIWSEATSTAISTIYFTDGVGFGLTPSASYSYTVAAYDAAGNVSAQSSAVSATTLAVATSLSSTTPLPLSHSCGSSIYVPQDTNSIQTAINAACSGDIIYVGPGTYYESLTISKSGLTLKGASGSAPETVIIDAGGAGAVVNTSKITSFTIDGLTLQNATQTGSSPGGVGLYISPIWSGNFTARNLIVKNNIYGIYVTNINSGTVTLDHNLIVNNLFNGIEGNNIGSSQLIITNNTIANNSRSGYNDWAGGGSRTFKNNIIVLNGWYGTYFNYASGRTILYNDTWGNAKGNYYYGDLYNNPFSFAPSPGTGELSVDPKFVSSNDYHLQSSSSVINNGDPAITDPDGTRSDMGVYYFVGTPADTTPPVISNVQTSNITQNSATITWTTNESSDSQVEYDLETASTLVYGQKSSLDSSLATSHSVIISGLLSGTKYQYQVLSKDVAGNVAKANEYYFTTTAIVLSAPTTSGNGMGWSYSWQGVRDSKIGQSMNFGYPSSMLNISKIRLYQKHPQDASYSVVADFMINSSKCVHSSSSGEWFGSILSCISPAFIGIERIKAGGDPYTAEAKSIPVSSYVVGDYNYYIVAVGADGQEGPLSPIAKFVFLEPTNIISPTISQSPVSLRPTIQWTVGSGWPSSLPDWPLPRGLPINVVVFDDVIVSKWFWISGTYGNQSQIVYDGPALTPGKKYYTSILLAVNDNKNYVSHLILPNAVSEFWVSTSTTSNVNQDTTSHLAQILESLNNILNSLKLLR